MLSQTNNRLIVKNLESLSKFYATFGTCNKFKLIYFLLNIINFLF